MDLHPNPLGTEFPLGNVPKRLFVHNSQQLESSPQVLPEKCPLEGITLSITCPLKTHGIQLSFRVVSVSDEIVIVVDPEPESFI